MAGPTPSFIELSSFTADWAALELGDADLAELQHELADDPAAGKPVPGGDGLRKLRFAPAGWNRGRSGGVRVYYADLPGIGLVVLGRPTPRPG